MSCTPKDGTLFYVPDPHEFNVGSFKDSTSSRIVITGVVGMWEYPSYVPNDDYIGELWFNEGGDFELDERSTRGGKWGLVKKINKDGYKLIAEPQFDWTGEFKNGLAAVLINGLWGFINTKGELVIKPQYEDRGEIPSRRARWNETKQMYEDQFSDWLYQFDKGQAWVQQNGRYGIIDTSGVFVVEPKYELVFDSGTELWRELKWFRQDGKYGLINRKGKVIFQPFVDSMADCRIVHDNLVWMKDNGLWKLLDQKGNEKLTQRYGKIAVCDGYTWINLGYQPRAKISLGNPGKWGLVDSLGQIMIDPSTESVEYGGYEIPIQRNGRWGYINIDGQFRREPEPFLVFTVDDPGTKPVFPADTAIALKNLRKIQELIPDISMTYGTQKMGAIGTIKINDNKADLNEIQGVFNQYVVSISNCYFRAQDTTGMGTITLEVTIFRNGRVVGVRVVEDHMGSDVVMNCVTNRIRTIHFPRSANKIRKVTVPFAFVK